MVQPNGTTPDTLQLKLLPERRQILRVEADSKLPPLLPDVLMWRGDVAKFLSQLPKQPIFDLIVTSPPYNIGKEYEQKCTLKEYLAWQRQIIRQLVPRLKETGSLCWQVGNFVD